MNVQTRKRPPETAWEKREGTLRQVLYTTELESASVAFLDAFTSC
jgi:hypothetical protein